MLSLRISEIIISNWALTVDWLSQLGLEYGVNPYIFAFLYIGLAPLVWISAALAIRNLRSDKPAEFHIVLTSLTFLSPYIYIFYAGHNIPYWVYGIIIGLLSLGSYNLLQKFRATNNAVK